MALSSYAQRTCTIDVRQTSVDDRVYPRRFRRKSPFLKCDSVKSRVGWVARRDSRQIEHRAGNPAEVAAANIHCGLTQCGLTQYGCVSAECEARHCDSMRSWYGYRRFATCSCRRRRQGAGLERRARRGPGCAIASGACAIGGQPGAGQARSRSDHESIVG